MDNASPRPGDRVTVTVEQVLQFGVFVRLENGTPGYIRARELGAPDELRPGDELEAEVMALEEPGRRMELSYRATRPDPWEQFRPQLRPGAVLRGSVKDVRPFGVFVELRPGVDGLVAPDQLAAWPVERPEELLWSGDRVEVVVTSIHEASRQVRLSMRKRAESLTLAASVLQHIQPVEAAQPIEAAEELATPAARATAAEIERVGRILIVEDHDEVRSSLVEWLRQRGYAAEGVKTADAGRAALQEQAHQLLLVDIELPGEDGLALARDLRQQGNDATICMMSIAEWLAGRADEIAELDVAAILLKPLDLDEIEHLLAQIGRGERPEGGWRPADDEEAAALAPFERLDCLMNSSRPLQERFRAGLEELVALTGAETGIIFGWDPGSQAVTVSARVGSQELNRQAAYGLGESPVWDVMRQQMPVFESTITPRVQGRFRKLLELLEFRSCVGVPIPAGTESRHALFLFHPRPGFFSRYRLRDAQATASLLAVALERQQLDEHAQAVNRMLVSGQLAAGFGHEVYNKISGLEIQLRNLAAIGRRPGAEVGPAVEGALGTALDLKETVHLFQRLMRTGIEGELAVNQVLRQAAAQLTPLARRDKVEIQLELDEELPACQGDPVRLLQAFLNIMLNAVQQMALKPAGHHSLRVSSRRQYGGPIEVRFRDSGPGIHRQLWEAIFALGFTTRAEGSGLGLYVCKSLIESLGGRIRVEESLMTLGSTFLVELPAG